MADKRITMLQTRHGSRNGLDIELFEVGKSYVVPASLADVFERFKHARIDGDVVEPVEIPAPPIADAPAPVEAASPEAPAEKPKGRHRPGSLSGKMDRSLSSED